MNSPAIPKLISDPGKPATPVLIGRVLKSEFRGIGRKLSRRLGLSKLYDALPENNRDENNRDSQRIGMKRQSAYEER